MTRRTADRASAPAQRLARAGRRPVGVAEHPERPPGVDRAGDARGNQSIQGRLGQAVRAGSNSAIPRSRWSRAVSNSPAYRDTMPSALRAIRWRVASSSGLREAQQARSHVASRRELAPHDIEPPDAPQDRQELGRFSHLRAQLPGSRVRAGHLGRRVALDRRQPRAARDLQGQFLLGTLPRLRQGSGARRARASRVRPPHGTRAGAARARPPGDGTARPARSPGRARSAWPARRRSRPPARRSRARAARPSAGAGRPATRWRRARRAPAGTGRE